MFKTHQGVNRGFRSEIYLRPETAQGIFVNFLNAMRTTRKKLPAGICQIGKSFRNEITPGNFIFRVREFEQMELEFFCKPGEDLEWFDYWRAFCRDWLLSLGMNEENLRLRDHEKDKLAFYSKATTDFEYLFPFGWGELWGVADRTDYDLKQHSEHSGKSLEYLDPTTNEKFIPYCVEPSVGVERLVLAFLCDAYDEEELEGGDVRTVLHLHPALAPFKVRRDAPAEEQAGRSGEGDLPASWRRNSAWITTRPAPSASAIAVRTRSARPTASAWTSIPKPPATSPCATATPCSRKWFRSQS